MDGEPLHGLEVERVEVRRPARVAAPLKAKPVPTPQLVRQLYEVFDRREKLGLPRPRVEKVVPPLRVAVWLPLLRKILGLSARLVVHAPVPLVALLLLDFLLGQLLDGVPKGPLGRGRKRGREKLPKKLKGHRGAP